MQETDISKMKVADLKRELKQRGLTTTGNKTELQDRLQTALLDGDISLEEAAISGEDLLDEDGILTDEDEDLLKSPTGTPTVDELLSLPKAKTTGMTTVSNRVSDTSVPTTTNKKVVLKRNISAITDVTSTNNSLQPQIKSNDDENTDPLPIKQSKHDVITMGDEKNAADSTSKEITKLSQQQRLEMRAKKFGSNSTASAAITESTDQTVVPNDKQIELLKKRAERFGCVVSSKMAKLDAQEKLEKRQQRFNLSGKDNGTTTDEKLLKRQQRFGKVDNNNALSKSTNANSDVWAEKARLRLERFNCK